MQGNLILFEIGNCFNFALLFGDLCILKTGQITVY